MPGKPAEPAAPAGSEVRVRGPVHEPAGPISLARHVKADGRALLLFTRTTPEPQPERAVEPERGQR